MKVTCLLLLFSILLLPSCKKKKEEVARKSSEPQKIEEHQKDKETVPDIIGLKLGDSFATVFDNKFVVDSKGTKFQKEKLPVPQAKGAYLKIKQAAHDPITEEKYCLDDNQIGIFVTFNPENMPVWLDKPLPNLSVGAQYNPDLKDFVITAIQIAIPPLPTLTSQQTAPGVATEITSGINIQSTPGEKESFVWAFPKNQTLILTPYEGILLLVLGSIENTRELSRKHYYRRQEILKSKSNP